MKSKEEIVQNWLPRYTGQKLAEFGKYILLTNFSNYVTLFAEWHSVDVVGRDRPMQCATAGDITIVNFGMGSPTAATVMDLLTAISPKAVLFLGKCGAVFSFQQRLEAQPGKAPRQLALIGLFMAVLQAAVIVRDRRVQAVFPSGMAEHD